MYSGNVATQIQFSARDRVVGAWIPATSCECPDVKEATWFLMGRLVEYGPVRIIAIGVSPFRIGRHSSVDLSIPLPTVSRVHAEILTHRGQLEVRDLSSSNGTFLNGQRIRDSVIIESDTLLHIASVPFHICLMPA